MGRVLPAPLLLLAALALRWAHGEIPIVRLMDQEGPILEGSSVTLECLTEEDGADMSQFTFQKYSPWLRTWVSLDDPDRLRCWFYDVNVTRAHGRLLLGIAALQSWHAGAYRCVGPGNAPGNATDPGNAPGNATDPGNTTDLGNAPGNATASAEITLRVEYLRSVFVARAHTWCGTVGDSLTVREGEDVELTCSADASQPPEFEWSRQGDDWIVASAALTLPRLSRAQAGTYVCRAGVPGLPLARSRALRLEVLGSQRSSQLELGLSPPRLLLLAVGLPALLLLLLVVGLGAFLLHRRRAKPPAGEEPGQRTPIYKGSLESVPSAGGDKQPLVL